MDAQTGTVFDAFEQALRSSGPIAALDQLVEDLSRRGEYRAALDAQLLKARHELGLPTIQVGNLSEMPEPKRTEYEDRYVNAIRDVGSRLLLAGDIPGAWPYFRAIGEGHPVAVAIENYKYVEGDERLGAIIEVAFNQGAHPRLGYKMVLDHYGICSAISAYEGLPPDEATRVEAAGHLVRQLHAQLVASLRAEIARRGQPLPAEGAGVPELIAGRDWLFADEAYHIDVSHLAAVVRVATIVTDPEILKLAVELTDYGRRLSGRHRYEGDPPFEDVYEDHAVYLRALLGHDVDAAIARFRGKLPPTDPDGDGDLAPAVALARLLVRLNRLEEAIDVSAEHLAGAPDSIPFCPSLAQLCQRAGRLDRLAEIARRRGDLVNYAAAVL